MSDEEQINYPLANGYTFFKVKKYGATDYELRRGDIRIRYHHRGSGLIELHVGKWHFALSREYDRELHDLRDVRMKAEILAEKWGAEQLLEHVRGRLEHRVRVARDMLVEGEKSFAEYLSFCAEVNSDRA